jgi:hypothetical protein
MIDLILGPFAPYIVAALSGLVVYFFGYRSADKARTAKEAKQRLKDMKTAQEVRDEVEILDDVELARRASRWVRND